MNAPLRFGIAGLGTAQADILPQMAAHPHIKVTAAADIRSAGVVAHGTCREDLMAGWESTHALLARLYPQLRPELEEVSMDLPDLTFSDSVTLHVGRPPVELRYLGPAHTRGDIVVFLPAQEVLFAGDLAFHGCGRPTACPQGCSGSTGKSAANWTEGLRSRQRSMVRQAHHERVFRRDKGIRSP